MTQWFRPDAHRQRAVGAARLPVGTDEDWILAAVHPDETGAAAWSRVRSTFDVLGLPDGRERLVPLLYETVSRTTPDDPLLPELGRGRLLRLTDRRRLLAAVVPVIDALVDESIEVMVLKGAALADVYESPAHRPMVDVDLVVRLRDLPQAVDILSRKGLRAEVDVLRPVKVACRHSMAFVPIAGGVGTIDLHWMASPQLAPVGVARAQWRRPWYLELADDEFWLRSRSIEFEGVAVSAPSMTDLLLLSVLHGTRFGIADDTRWAVDAITILRRRGGEVDWDLLVANAQRHRVGEVITSSLDYLSERILLGTSPDPIPSEVMSRLRSTRVSKRERLVERLSERESSMRPGRARLAIDITIRHLAFTAGEPLLPTMRSFPWFVALWTGVERPRQLIAVRRRLHGLWRRWSKSASVRREARASRVSSTPLGRVIVIAATPRTGSSLLVAGLNASGVVTSMTEHLQSPSLARHLGPHGRLRSRILGPDVAVSRASVGSIRRAISHLVADRRASDGTFGVKVMWSNFEEVLLRRGLDVESLGGPVTWIRIRRGDRLRQAVSLERARRTGIWRLGGPRIGGELRSDLHFDAARITEELGIIEEYEAGWTAYFSERGISPLEVTYEELDAQYEETMRRVLDHLGAADTAVPPRQLQRQADRVNVDWVERYLAEASDEQSSRVRPPS